MTDIPDPTANGIIEEHTATDTGPDTGPDSTSDSNPETPDAPVLAITTTQSWQSANDAWLSAAIAHLRLTLADFAATRQPPDPRPTTPGEVPPQPTPLPASRWRFGFGRETPTPLTGVQPVQPAESDAPSPEAITEARKTRDALAAQMETPPALHLLAQRLGLSDFERDLLLLCAAIELDTRLAGLCAQAQGDPNQGHPTFALALAMAENPSWDILSPERPLRYWRLIEINQPGNTALTQSALRADERMVNFIKGMSYLDYRITPFLTPFEATVTDTLPASQDQAADLAASILRRAGGATAPLVQLIGDDPVSQQIVARHVAQRLDLTAFQMAAAMLPKPTGELETFARLWHRESILMPIALFLDASDAPESQAQVARFVARSGGVFLYGAREARGDLGAMVQAVPVSRPTPAEQAELWTSVLENPDKDTVARLSGQFDLDAPAILRIAAVTAGNATDAALWQACIDTSALHLDQHAQRIEAVATWDDIVLPDQEMSVLRQLAAQVARRSQVYDDWGFRARLNRGLGISALFAGPSGTGKTMAAEVIANAINLRLYRIDLSAVVSKYIGETEKNLRALFDAAEAGGAILFFDEADALFGKRSEVRDSHDRYANIETSYLLQRIESFRGLAILSTNMRSALDEAFLRRLRFIVNFPYPSVVQRRAIWQRAWPDTVPREGLDFDRLARLNLSGGNISTVALNATFLAAEAEGPVTMTRVLTAARSEYEKLERPINEADFRWQAETPLREARG